MFWTRRSGTVSTRWDRNPLTAMLWPLALAGFANLVFRSFSMQRAIGDFYILHDGAVRLVTGGSVYQDPFFLLTPSALAVVGPFGFLGQQAAFMVWNAVAVLCVPVAVVAVCRFVGAAWRGPMGAAVLLGLTLSEALTTTLIIGNLNNSLLLAIGSAYLLAEKSGRTTRAGVLLGVCLAIKPVLVLVVLVPLVRSRWRTVGWAVAIPAVLNAVGLALVPDRHDFFAVTVPGLLHARVEANSSLWAIGSYLGVPPWITTVGRVLVLVAVVVCVWRLRRHRDPVVQLGVSYALLLLAALLCLSLGQGYYSLFLVPAFATAVVPGSPFRHPAAWLAGYLCLTLDVWNAPQFPAASFDFYVLHWTAGWLLLTGVLVRWALRTTAAGEPPGGRPGPSSPAPAEDDGEPVLRR